MTYLIKCLKCGVIHEHDKPIALLEGDAKNYVCKSCKAIGQIKILRGGKDMFIDKDYCFCGHHLEEGDDELDYMCKYCR